tara:strand:- start:308 stop:580 length:273 start_codon:yes stop_codon:yes gene_type:complete
MKDYLNLIDNIKSEELTNLDYQYIFNTIEKETLIFDDIKHNITCVRYELLNLLKHDDNAVAETAYHMAKIINLLRYWEIYKGEQFTDNET